MNGAIPLLLLYTLKAHSNLSPSASDNFSHACPKEVVHRGYACVCMYVYIYIHARTHTHTHTHTHTYTWCTHRRTQIIRFNIRHTQDHVPSERLATERRDNKGKRYHFFLCTIKSTISVSFKTMPLLYTPPVFCLHKRIYVFYMNLRTKKQLFPYTKLTDCFFAPDMECLLRGTNWIYKCNSNWY